MSRDSFHHQVVEILRLEAESIAQVAARLDREAIERAIELLANCAGRAILIGVGKSGNIAQKIAATLTSTGTPAVFLHPSDALHGGIGLVTSGDVAVVLSNGGETEEVLAVLPLLKNRQIPIIAIVGNMNSTLARRATVALDARVGREACPLNLAPTTSTTVALALGDALAMTLMRVKRITPEDFALNHPAGGLGKRLTLRVADLMHAAHPQIEKNATWLDVLRAITRGGLGAVSVVEADGKLVGIVTDGDVRRAIERCGTRELETLNCEMMMTRAPVVTTPDALAFDALQLMERRPSQISVLPVIDAEWRSIGMLRLHDIVRSGI